MSIKNWLIEKLEKNVEFTAGNIKLEELSEEERNKCFIEFGEGDANLILFLKTAYEKGAPSIFCCSGHGTHSAYVDLKVTDENIELLRKVGKVLSKRGVTTNFESHHVMGMKVNYRAMRDNSTEWLNIATQIMQNPELFDDSEPEIYYHEEMKMSYKPFGFDLKKKLLTYLRKSRTQLLVSGETLKERRKKFLDEFSKTGLNERKIQPSNELQKQQSINNSKEDRGKTI